VNVGFVCFLANDDFLKFEICVCKFYTMAKLIRDGYIFMTVCSYIIRQSFALSNDAAPTETKVCSKSISLCSFISIQNIQYTHCIDIHLYYF